MAEIIIIILLGIMLTSLIVTTIISGVHQFKLDKKFIETQEMMIKEIEMRIEKLKETEENEKK